MMNRFDAKSAVSLLVMGWLAGCAGHVVLVAEEPDAGTPAPEAAPSAPDTGPEPMPEAGPDVPDSPHNVNCTDLLPPEIRAKRIVFDSDREQNFVRQIYVMNGDGSNVSRVMADMYADKEPFFDPDGSGMTFTSDRNGVNQIYFYKAQTQAVTKVTNRNEGADQSSISRDGAWVAYHSGASVYVSHLDGSGEQLVATGLDDFNAFFWPHFSADGTELVFDRNNEIDAAKIIGMTQRQIVQNTTTTIKSPAVSPDGLEVAYDVWCDQPGASVWTTPFATKTDACKGRRVSAIDNYVARRPAWGSSTYLAYERVDSASNIASIAVISRVAGSVACPITLAGTDNRNPSWSP